MGPALNLPRLLFGEGTLATLAGELALLGSARPLLVSDRGIERAGLLDGLTVEHRFLDVPENPTAAGADGAAAMYRQAGCDGVVAIGGGSVLDTAKMVAALVATELERAGDLIGRPELIGAVAPLVAVPTTIGTGSESSPVAALHLVTGGPAIGTRHPSLVPRLAICDPDLARTLPRRLVAATAIDALSHCIEGLFAEPANPIVDALALDGAARVFADIGAALAPGGGAARASLMAAAFAGGAAIHKGLGPAHAVALACADQDVHHGTLIGVALPRTLPLLEKCRPATAARLRAAIGLDARTSLADALTRLVASLGLPATLADAGYRIDDAERLADDMARSHFNRTSPYAPTRDEYRRILSEIAG